VVDPAVRHKKETLLIFRLEFDKGALGFPRFVDGALMERLSLLGGAKQHGTERNRRPDLATIVVSHAVAGVDAWHRCWRHPVPIPMIGEVNAQVVGEMAVKP